MGDVYRATDGLLSRTVAVKVLAERHARNPDVRARFTREARAAARLSAHPNVVTVFDVGEHDGQPFIVMEYLDGGSVHDRVRSTPVAPGRAIEWLRQAAAGLDAAHAQGIVHRDVKPANLLLDDEDRVHVTDFGIASAAGFDTLTLPGTVLGTAGYLSPEQARGETATAASDRYALGVVAYELLTGRRPYAAETPVTEAFAHLNAPIPSAAQVAPALPARRRRRLRAGAGKGAGRSSCERGRARRGARRRLPRRRAGDRCAAATAPDSRATGAATAALARASRVRRAPPRRADRCSLRLERRRARGPHDHARHDDGVDGLRHRVDPHGHRDGDRSRGRDVRPSSGVERLRAQRRGLRAHAGRGLRRRAPAARAGGLTARRARGRWPRRTRATTSRSPASRSGAATACSSSSTAPRRCRATDRRSTGSVAKRRSNAATGPARATGRTKSETTSAAA